MFCIDILAVAAQVMSEPRKFKREVLQLKLVEEASCAMEDNDYQSNQIEVRNVPHTVSCELVKAYFEGPKSGSCANAVAECKKTEPGVLIVTFYDPNGERSNPYFHNHFISHILRKLRVLILANLANGWHFTEMLKIFAFIAPPTILVVHPFKAQ